MYMLHIERENDKEKENNHTNFIEILSRILLRVELVLISNDAKPVD